MPKLAGIQRQISIQILIRDIAKLVLVMSDSSSVISGSALMIRYGYGAPILRSKFTCLVEIHKIMEDTLSPKTAQSISACTLVLASGAK
jgi:hypothetical protein